MTIRSFFTGASGIPTMDWFPKQFSPGDIDGGGARKLLGRPNLEPAAVLVRETAQNSWDAGRHSDLIDFNLNLRQLAPGEHDALRRHVFTGPAPETGLVDLLSAESVWVLEVSDRGTLGLGGPVRNDCSVDEGVATDFIDFVFNIGAPRDVNMGGGTYGFGKTVAYVASAVGSIVIWSRCKTAKGLEHRLIASAIGGNFDMDGRRFTGRHWWGQRVESRVEPLVGEPARQLAEEIFSSRFSPDETGTSILILAPQLGGETPQQNIDNLAQATMENLWPKLLPARQGDRRMRISLQLNDDPVQLPDIMHHPELQGYGECLQAVRSAQAGEDYSSRVGMITTHEIRSERPKKLLGHLALMRFPSSGGNPNLGNSIALMRHQAELVVRYTKAQELDVEGFLWAGVFKPIQEVDNSFASAEPPAHDDWAEKTVEDPAQRKDVRIALERIKTHTKQFLSPLAPASASDGVTHSTARVGDMLAGLIAELDGTGPTWSAPPSELANNTGAGILEKSDNSNAEGASPSLGSRSGAKPATGRRRLNPRAVIVAAEQSDSTDASWTRTSLTVEIADSGTDGADVDIQVKVGTEGSSYLDEEVVRVLGWAIPSQQSGFSREPLTLGPNTRGIFIFEAKDDLAIDVDAVVVRSR